MYMSGRGKGWVWGRGGRGVKSQCVHATQIYSQSYLECVRKFFNNIIHIQSWLHNTVWTTYITTVLKYTLTNSHYICTRTHIHAYHSLISFLDTIGGLMKLEWYTQGFNANQWLPCEEVSHNVLL